MKLKSKPAIQDDNQTSIVHNWDWLNQCVIGKPHIRVTIFLSIESETADWRDNLQ
jgi:hypothetical protein